MNTLIEHAKSFATDAHKHGVREYTGEPYIVHPAAVAALVESVGGHRNLIVAAWLHDVIEECGVPLEKIYQEFGMDVAVLVGELTDVSTMADGNRATRKALDRDHLACAHPAAKTVKLADLIHNSKSIIEHAPGFAKVYIEEKRLLLEVLKEGDQTLWAMAKGIVERYRAGVKSASPNTR